MPSPSLFQTSRSQTLELSDVKGQFVFGHSCGAQTAPLLPLVLTQEGEPDATEPVVCHLLLFLLELELLIALIFHENSHCHFLDTWCWRMDAVLLPGVCAKGICTSLMWELPRTL